MNCLPPAALLLLAPRLQHHYLDGLGHGVPVRPQVNDLLPPRELAHVEAGEEVQVAGGVVGGRLLLPRRSMTLFWRVAASSGGAEAGALVMPAF